MSTIFEYKKVAIVIFITSIGWLLGIYAGVSSHSIRVPQFYLGGMGILATIMVLEITLISGSFRKLTLSKMILRLFLMFLVGVIEIVGITLVSGLLGRLLISQLNQFPPWQQVNPWEGTIFVIILGYWLIPAFTCAIYLFAGDIKNKEASLVAVTAFLLAGISSIILVWSVLPFQSAVLGLYIGFGISLTLLILPLLYKFIYAKVTVWIKSILAQTRTQLIKQAVTERVPVLGTGLSVGFLIGFLIGLDGSNLAKSTQFLLVDGLIFSLIFVYFFIVRMHSSGLSRVGLLITLMVVIGLVLMYSGLGFLFDSFVARIIPWLPNANGLRPFYMLLFGSWLVPSFAFTFQIFNQHVPSLRSVFALTFFSQIVVMVLTLIWDQAPLLYAATGSLSGLIGTLVVSVIFSSLSRMRRPKLPIQHSISEIVARDEYRGQETIPLKSSFRFAHEPTIFEARTPQHIEFTAQRFVSREIELRELIQRIVLSTGGAFLITGYRGVGKTSFVNRAIWEIKEYSPWLHREFDPVTVLDIHLNLAKAFNESELMHYLIRSIYSRLVELGIYNLLDKDVKAILDLAVNRTSMSITRKSQQAREGSLGLAELAFGLNALGLSSKFSASSKQTKSEGVDMAFLSYDDKSAEYDILMLSRHLTRGYIPKQGRLRRFWQRMRRLTPKRTQIKIVFVFDELDKLDDIHDPQNGEDEPVIDAILRSLKNLFTSSGMVFIFIAGKDLQERWLEETSQGDSIYESVFAYHKYLPAMWVNVDELCDRLVSFENAPSQGTFYHSLYQDFKSYLAFVGRGIPRRILRSFNQYVSWDGSTPYLSFKPAEIRYIRFYAKLQEMIEEEDEQLFLSEMQIEQDETKDKRRLGIYYLIDWLLNQGNRSFTQNDLLVASRKLNQKIAPSESQADGQLRRLIKLLLAYEYLEVVRSGSNQVIIDQGEPMGSIAERYRIPERRIVEMGNSLEILAEELGSPIIGTDDLGMIGPYKLLSLLGEGGAAQVYQVLDTRNHRNYALKILHKGVDPYFSQKFSQEKKIIKDLNHPNIVKFCDEGEYDNRDYYVMELVDGIGLRVVMEHYKPLTVDLALTIIYPLLDALSHVHDKGIVWRDIKPENVLISKQGRIYLIDPGIGVRINERGDITVHTGIVGTPSYMSPEQFSGKSVDRQSDVYSVGILLYEMLTGTRLFQGSIAYVRLHQVGDPPVAPKELNQAIPNGINSLILKCLEKDMGRRYSDARALKRALPEFSKESLPRLVKELQNLRESQKSFDYTEEASLLYLGNSELLGEYMNSKVSPTNMAQMPEHEFLNSSDAIDRAILWLSAMFSAQLVFTQSSTLARSQTPIADVSTITGISNPPDPNSWDDRTEIIMPTFAVSSSSKKSAFTTKAFQPPVTTSTDVHASYENTEAEIRSTSTPHAATYPEPYSVPVSQELSISIEAGLTLTYPSRRFVLATDRPLRVGRSSENDIVLVSAEKASRHHAIIELENHQPLIRDLNSLQGTFVNGERVESQVLHHGDLINIGEVMLRFHDTQYET